jgi:hypothetical protein
MRGTYVDPSSRLTIPDLESLTPVQWIRLAAPIVEGEGISSIRKQQAELMTQSDDIPFSDFFTALMEVYMV